RPASENGDGPCMAPFVLFPNRPSTHRLAYSSASAAGGDSRRCIATLALQRIGQQFAQRATTLVERGALGRIGGIAQQAVAHRFVTRIDLIRWINPRGTMASLVGGQVLVARSDAYHFTRRCRWCSHG